MTSDRTLRAIPRVAELIAKADALLITAGAGMGVDSGLPDFRGKDGFWGAYPALGKRGISFEQMAQPTWFSDDPAMAWAFYGHRQQLYRETKPHDGYRMLREWGQAMPAGYFVVTSNVDGHFEAAGFPSEQILEQHGSLHRYQCTVRCSEALWQDDPPDLDIDLEALRARGTLPRCPECGVVARPNVMMFGDVRWVAGATQAQRQRYAKWLALVRGKRLVILELGAGTAIATIRSLGERLAAERARVTLVRINPDATDADEPVVPIRMTALEALRRIEERLPEGFRERCRALVPEKPAMSDEEAGRLIEEHFRKNPGAVASARPADHLKDIRTQAEAHSSRRDGATEGIGMNLKRSVSGLVGMFRSRVERLRQSPEVRVAQARKKLGYDLTDEDAIDSEIEQENSAEFDDGSRIERDGSRWSMLPESPATAESRRRRQLGYETDLRLFEQRFGSFGGSGAAREQSSAPSSSTDWFRVYGIGFAVTWGLVFIGTWIYCIASYGFLLGVGLGWLPAMIVATLLGALWPIVAAVLVIMAIVIFDRQS